MSSDLVLLARIFDPTEAHIIRGVLESENIPAFVMDDQHNTVAWHMQFALGGTRIMVLREDLEAARDLIKDIVQQTSNESADTPSERLETYSALDRVLQIGIFLFTGLPFLFRRRYRRSGEDQEHSQHSTKRPENNDRT